MPAYDAVFWDVGGVILSIPSITRSQEAFIERVAAEYDLGPPDAVLEAWRSALRDHFLGREGTEYVTAREGRAKAASAAFGDAVPPEVWQAIWIETRDEYVEPNPHVVETIRTLADAGLYQAIISDADEGGIPTTLDRLGIGDCIRHITTSEAVGYVKPDRRIFQAALDKAGIGPSRGLMIGDKYENDMVGASTVGLTTVAYGADDGPAVDHRIDDVRALVDIVCGSDG